MKFIVTPAQLLQLSRLTGDFQSLWNGVAGVQGNIPRGNFAFAILLFEMCRVILAIVNTSGASTPVISDFLQRYSPLFMHFSVGANADYETLDEATFGFTGAANGVSLYEGKRDPNHLTDVGGGIRVHAPTWFMDVMEVIGIIQANMETANEPVLN